MDVRCHTCLRGQRWLRGYILGDEPDKFWHDHKGAKINAIRTRKAIAEADIVVVGLGINTDNGMLLDAGMPLRLANQLLLCTEWSSTRPEGNWYRRACSCWNPDRSSVFCVMLLMGIYRQGHKTYCFQVAYHQVESENIFSPEKVMVLGDRVLVNLVMCSSISFSTSFWVSLSGKNQTTVRIFFWDIFLNALKDTFSIPSRRLGHLVLRSDSNNSHSSSDGKVLINILVYIVSSPNSKYQH